jgi:hypothetical protein
VSYHDLAFHLRPIHKPPKFPPTFAILLEWLAKQQTIIGKKKAVNLVAFWRSGTTKKWTVFDVLKSWSKKPRQNFLTWQKLKRQKS